MAHQDHVAELFQQADELARVRLEVGTRQRWRMHAMAGAGT